MKIVTFNTRTDNPVDGINNVKYRMPFIKAKLESEKADIIGFQELMTHTFEEFKQMLPDYYILGFGREADYKGESVPIAVRKDSFNVIEMGGCWLSDTPYVPASRFEGQSGCPRTIMWVKLLDIRTGKRFRVYNTHLDHPDEEHFAPRRQELHQILQMIDADRAADDIPMILMGDFNTLPRNWETEELDARTDMDDFTKDISVTFHKWGDKASEKKIDYIYGSKEWSVSDAVIWEECHDGVWLSDHYPVCVNADLAD